MEGTVIFSLAEGSFAGLPLAQTFSTHAEASQRVPRSVGLTELVLKYNARRPGPLCERGPFYIIPHRGNNQELPVAPGIARDLHKFSMFDTNFQNDIVTPIPPDVDPQSLINILHDHGTVIHCQPIVTGHEVKDRDPETGWIIYNVFEKISVLPFKLWQRDITFQLHFNDKQEGVKSYINASGVKSEADYTVRASEHGESEGTGWVLAERIDTTCNFLIKWLVVMNMLPVRKKLHEQLIEKAKERQKDGGKSNEGESAPSG